MFQFLSTLEVRTLEKLWLDVPSYLENRLYTLIRIDYKSPPESIQVAARVAESVPKTKMLKKNLN